MGISKMTKHYTDQEKIDAVRFLFILKNEGTVSIDDYTDVSNVRELCKELNVSSYSLYKWVRELKAEGVIRCEDCSWGIDCKSYGSFEGARGEACNDYTTEPFKDNFDEFEVPRNAETIHSETMEIIADIEQNGFAIDEKEKKKKDSRLIVQSEIRFFGNLASMLGIRNYGSLPLKQLQLAVGLAIVKRSGLGGN